MAKRAPIKGAPLWSPLPCDMEEYKGVEIGIKFVGGNEVRLWDLELSDVSSKERVRQIGSEDQSSTIEALRLVLATISRGVDDPKKTALEALQSDKKPPSTDYMRESDKIANEVLKACVMGVRGVEDLEEDDAQGALDLIEYLGIESKVFDMCREQQSLTLRQQFRS